jgi:hypothetical protein
VIAALTSRLTVYACIALILIGLGAGSVWYFLSGRIAALQAERKELHTQLERAASARKAEMVISAKRAETRQKRAAGIAASEANDAAALRANPAWADTPLPKEVADALAE